MYRQINPEWDGKPIKLYASTNGAYQNYMFPPLGIVVKFQLNTFTGLKERYGMAVSMGGFYPTGGCRTVFVEFARGLNPRQLHLANNVDEWMPLDGYDQIPVGVRRDIELAEVNSFWEELNVFKKYHGAKYVMRGQNIAHGVKYLKLCEEEGSLSTYEFVDDKAEATVFDGLVGFEAATKKAQELTAQIASCEVYTYNYIYGHLMPEAVEVQ